MLFGTKREENPNRAVHRVWYRPCVSDGSAILSAVKAGPQFLANEVRKSIFKGRNSDKNAKGNRTGWILTGRSALRSSFLVGSTNCSILSLELSTTSFSSFERETSYKKPSLTTGSTISRDFLPFFLEIGSTSSNSTQNKAKWKNLTNYAKQTSPHKITRESVSEISWHLRRIFNPPSQVITSVQLEFFSQFPFWGGCFPIWWYQIQ